MKNNLSRSKKTASAIFDICFKNNIRFTFKCISLGLKPGIGNKVKVDVWIDIMDFNFAIDENGFVHRIGAGNAVYQPSKIKQIFSDLLNLSL